jgi:predicted enzyme related to lactoylglutathione lyase
MPRPVHFEIHADKPQRALKFYKAVFGWKFQKWAGPMEYWLVTTGDAKEPGIDGGLMKRMGPPPPEMAPVSSYVCTIGVSNVDAYEPKVKKNGGTIVVPKTPIPGVGWLIYCKDTEGNLFGITHEDKKAK